jgi:hypothetical protein
MVRLCHRQATLFCADAQGKTVQTLLDSAHFLVEYDVVGRVARVTRTAARFKSMTECEEAHDQVVSALDRLQRSEIGVLFDTRAAPARGDPLLERALKRYVPQMFDKVPRVAFLVLTVVGRMQVTRLTSEERVGRAVQTFDDEAAALAFALGSRPLR